MCGQIINLCFDPGCRSATRQLRYDVNNLINNAASDMSVHWNKTNRAFTDRISETQDAHRNLKSNLILTKNVSIYIYIAGIQNSWEKRKGFQGLGCICTYAYICTLGWAD